MPDHTPTVAVSVTDYLYFVERAVRGMMQIVRELGDERANLQPAIQGANSAYGLLTHCLGVVQYWGGQLVAGRSVERDRLAEFDATGTVDELQIRVENVLNQLATDVTTVRSNEPLRREPDSWAIGPNRSLNQGAALFHLYEEMAQHHGQMEVLRDALLVQVRKPFEAKLEWLRAKQGVKWHRPGPEILPAWVADMDFPVAEPIRRAVEACLDRGDLGYPDWTAHPLAEPFSDRMKNRYGWQPNPEHVRGLTDLIQGLQIIIELATTPGQTVVAHTPNYPPFLAAIPRSGRELLAVPLIRDQGSWSWDHHRLDDELRTSNAKLLLLVNPHNPTGRVFTRPELEDLAELAHRHDLIVISDEIHAELTFEPHTHIPFASLSADTAARTVTITSATKAFNIAGLRTAVAHVGPKSLRDAWDRQPPDVFGAVNVLGVEATIAAWREGDEWLTGLRNHLSKQREHLTARLAELPGVTYQVPEATYLVWLDCQSANLPTSPASFFRENAGVELSDGSDFGAGSEFYARLNFATTTSALDAILDRMRDALLRHGSVLKSRR